MGSLKMGLVKDLVGWMVGLSPNSQEREREKRDLGGSLYTSVRWSVRSGQTKERKEVTWVDSESSVLMSIPPPPQTYSTP